MTIPATTQAGSTPQQREHATTIFEKSVADMCAADQAVLAAAYDMEGAFNDVAVTLEVWPHMIHAWPLWNAHLEPGRRALADAGAFLRRHLDAGRPSSDRHEVHSQG